MSEISAQDSSKVCVICFWKKTLCIVGGKPCCSNSGSHQSTHIADDLLGSGIIAKIRGWSETQQTGLAFTTNSNYTLECQPTSALSIGASYNFKLGGAFNISNRNLVSQSDRLVVNTWAPKIQAKDETAWSIPSACLGIGYCNMLVFANLQDNSRPPFEKCDLSPVLTELAIMRINELTISPMKLIRKIEHKLDEESRSWLILWFLYSSILKAKLKKMGHCKLLDNLELFRHIQEIFVSFRKELRSLLAVDCSNRVNWMGAFDESQRSLILKLRNTDCGTLYVKWVEEPEPLPGLIYYDPPQGHQSNNEFAEASSTGHQAESIGNEIIHCFNTEWATPSPAMIPGLADEELLIFSGCTIRTGDVSLDQDINMGIENFASRDDLWPYDFNEDHIGDHYTFF